MVAVLWQLEAKSGSIYSPGKLLCLMLSHMGEPRGAKKGSPRGMVQPPGTAIDSYDSLGACFHRQEDINWTLGCPKSYFSL